MTISRHIPLLAELDREAMRRRVEAEASGRSEANDEPLREWQTQSPLNREAYREADRFCKAIDGLDDQWRETLLKRYRSAGSSAAEPPRQRRLSFLRNWRIAGAMAATVAALAVGLWWMNVKSSSPDYVTATGDMQTVVLPDGSQVDLNTDTALTVEMLQNMRRISLLRGEAFFTVAPDAHRPFEVVAGRSHTRALGTAFNVRKDGGSTTVSVQEHAVRVTSDANGTSQDVNMGEQIRVAHDGTIGSTERYNDTFLLAWRRHRLMFENRPLPDVFQELNRYRAGYIIAADPKLRSLAVTASLDLRHPDEALSTLESILPIRMYRLTDRLVLVVRR